MKKSYLIFLLLLATAYGHATIITVNNEVGSSADYADVASAIAVATAGDSIYIQPSQSSYGSFTVTKQLVLMGAGHNPSFSPYNSQIVTLTMGAGSTGSIIKGLNINVINNASGNTINNIVFSGCRISSTGASPLQFALATLNNWIFEGCVIESTGGNGLGLQYLGANLILRNNYIISTTNIILINVPNGALIDHNVLVHIDNNSFEGAVYGSNLTLNNNIIISQASSNLGINVYCTDCSVNNNILFPQNGGAQFPAPTGGSNNLVNINPQFSAMSQVYGYSYNYDLQLATGSAGNNAATDGTDIGLYGGIATFSPIGVDSGSPHINTFTLGSSTAPQGGTITIHLNASGSGQ